MSKSAIRSQHSNILTRLAKHKKLTNAGKRWLIQALDPFHDSVQKPTGMPDAENANTLVDCIPVTSTITCPASITSGTWDCHIFNLPEMKLQTYQLFGQQTFDEFSGAPTGTFQLGSVNAISTPTGTAPINWSGQALGTNTSITNLTVDDSVCNANSRIVAIGIEVHNTTAEMYDQGAVYCYRLPQVNVFSTPTTMNQPATPLQISTAQAGYRSKLWPQTLADVAVAGNVLQWEAKKGAYIIPTFFDTKNPMADTMYGSRIFDDKQQASATNSVFSLGTTTYTMSTTAATTITNSLKSWKPQNFDTVGAYFTGLSLQTSLEVTIKYYVEFEPSFSDQTLYRLASPSPSYDVLALQLYSIAASKMPAGVPVNENNLGEWFMKVLDLVEEHGITMGDALSTFVPSAGIGGRIASEIAKQIKGHIGHAKSTGNQVRRVIAAETKKEARKEVKKVLIPRLERAAIR